jgi:hypothetical protein
MSHELPDATLVGKLALHGVAAEKTLLSVPVMVWSVMLSAEPPVFVSVTDKVFVGWLELVSFNFPKSKLAGISFTVPVVRVIVALPCLLLSVTDVAVMVTLGFVGTVAGAAYVVAVPLLVFASVIVPHADEHALPPWVSDQLTP